MVIGLTGSIATGKSTVTRYLLSKGYPVIDSDQLARLVVAKGSPVLEEIAKTFGQDLILASGDLNRKALGAIVFSDEEARLRLNAITHPAINGEMHKQIDQYESEGKRLIFCDVPLLFEGEMEDQFDEVWLVYTSEEIQLQRLMARDDIDEDTAMAKMNAQFSIEDKREMADEVISNEGSIEETHVQVDHLLMKRVFL
jgi:dephospho-CoA kinase